MTAIGESCRRRGHHLPAVYDPKRPLRRDAKSALSIKSAAATLSLHSTWQRRQREAEGAGGWHRAGEMAGNTIINDHSGDTEERKKCRTNAEAAKAVHKKLGGKRRGALAFAASRTSYPRQKAEGFGFLVGCKDGLGNDESMLLLQKRSIESLPPKIIEPGRQRNLLRQARGSAAHRPCGAGLTWSGRPCIAHQQGAGARGAGIARIAPHGRFAGKLPSLRTSFGGSL
jgi:hypothetical protein